MSRRGSAIECAAQGPAEWFDDLFGRYFPRVYAYAVTRVGTAQAEEVASETFAIAWRRRDVVPDVPLAWLIGVARNVIREQYRDALRQDLIAAELTAWAASTPVSGDVAELVADRDVLLRGLAALPEQDREVLMLLGWHGLSPREAADVLGCSRPALTMRVHRARRRLERRIGGAAHTARRESGGTDE
ncbi:sigma-70 family RNA polymerase sigma factor [Actinomadura graeca]|uniref:Sigma-70 family RNA polymerase sigma factor n=1 Tax=Actinomadura graeca TaxID=2750812 RepID=A0ABX8QYR4_9ACTN|nr:sigma-70 family RNA polymerase sigma factor [Actinomadura graeca]QXJ23803.1 sigma-70 family RNA polymerase sigma factor [Actinomadura graeca]